MGMLAQQPDAWSQVVEAYSKPAFLLAWAVAGIINIVTSQMYQRGLKMGELGDTLPFLSFTPAILLVFEYVFLHEPTSANGVFGTLLISGGGFWLGRASAAPRSKSQWLVLPPGAGIFTSIAIMWSVSSSFDKRGVRAASALVYGSTMKATIALGAFLVWVYKSRISSTPGSPSGHKAPTTSFKHIVLMIVWWALDMSAYFCQLSANSAGLPSSYLSAIRRAGCLFGLVLGRLLFAEEIGRKLPPVSVMVLGVCFLAFK